MLHAVLEEAEGAAVEVEQHTNTTALLGAACSSKSQGLAWVTMCRLWGLFCRFHQLFN
jgi:hypothetical protein